MIKKLFCVFFLLLLSIPVFGLEDLDFKGGFVSDNAHIIAEEQENKINAIISELQQQTTADIAVVTLSSLNGNSVGDTAVQIGREYKVGAKGVNNGIVFLVAPNEREARIEIGMGLEDKISNRKAESIMNNDIIPYFKNDDYSNGILKGVISISNLVAGIYDKKLDSTNSASQSLPSQKGENPLKDVPIFVWVALAIGIIITAISPSDSSRGNRRGRSGIGGRRGSFGGGGGFSGGHGATGKW